MTSSNGDIFHVTGPLCGEFTGPSEFPTQRPVTRSFDVFFNLRLTKCTSLIPEPTCYWMSIFTWSKFVEINVHWSVYFTQISIDLRQMLVCLSHPYMDKSWRRHQMETFTALLALGAGNSPVTSEYPAQRPVTRSFDVFYDLAYINGWVNNREAGDLRRYRARNYFIYLQTDLVNKD